MSLPADRHLDITAETCPMTFVRTRLALDAMNAGDVLVVRLKGEEPERSVPDATRALGHEVLCVTRDEAGVTTLRLRKA